MTVSKKLKHAREYCELSYADLAQLTGIAKSTLQRYETGSTTKIPLDAIEKIATALKTSPQNLLDWEDSEPNSALQNKDVETDITKMIDDLKTRLNTPNLTCKGKLVTEAEKQAIINGMQIALEIALQKK